MQLHKELPGCFDVIYDRIDNKDSLLLKNYLNLLGITEQLTACGINIKVHGSNAEFSFILTDTEQERLEKLNNIL